MVQDPLKLLETIHSLILSYHVSSKYDRTGRSTGLQITGLASEAGAKLGNG